MRISATLFLAVAAAGAAVSRLGVTILLAKVLSPSDFGLWASLSAVYAVVSFCDFGLSNALRNKLTELRVSQKNTIDIEKSYFYAVQTVFLVFGWGAAVIVLWVDSFFLVNLYGDLPTDQSQIFNDALRLTSCVFLLSMPFGLVSTLFFSYEENYEAGFWVLLNGLAPLACLIILMFSIEQPDLMTYITFYYLSVLSISIFMWIRFLTLRGWSVFHFSKSERLPKLKELFRPGITFMANDVSTGFLQNSPTVLVGVYAGLETAGLYNLMQKVFSFFSLTVQSTLNPIWTKITAFKSRPDLAFALANKTTLYVVLAGSIFILVVLIFADLILVAISKAEYQSLMSRELVFFVGVSALSYLIFDTMSLIQKSFGMLRFRLACVVVAALSYSALVDSISAYFGYMSVPLVATLLWAVLCVCVYVQRPFIRRFLMRERSL